MKPLPARHTRQRLSLLILLTSAWGCNLSDTAPGSDPDARRDLGASDLSSPSDLSTSPDLRADVDGCVPYEDRAICETLGAFCGVLDTYDNCGALRALDCGDCGEDATCEASSNACRCVPRPDAQLCAQLGASCGEVLSVDNCGAARTLSCGTCGADQACVAGQCEGSCEPESDADFCARNGKNCGQLSGTDSCGTMRLDVACGRCEGGESCQDNVCACAPESDEIFCGRLGKQCGPASGADNCGEMRQVASCGMCPATGGMLGCSESGQCAQCMPESDAQFCARNGKECGSFSGQDNCGTMRAVSNCGACQSGELCAAGQCECPEVICSASMNCGTVTNACGNSRSCGMGCGPDQVCQNNSCQCAAAVCPSGATCGSVSNACGSSANCGANGTTSCAGPYDQCQGNTCVCTPQTDQQLCDDALALCGNLIVTDRCGSTRTVNCGGCPPSRVCQENMYCCPTGQLCNF